MYEVSMEYVDRIGHAAMDLNGIAEAMLQIGESQRNPDDRDLFMFFAKTCRRICNEIDPKTARKISGDC